VPVPTSINQQKENAPDEVVDMRSTNVNVAQRGDVAVSAPSHSARHRKRDEESDGGEEKPALGPITHMRVKEIAKARIVQEQKDDRDREKN